MAEQHTYTVLPLVQPGRSMMDVYHHGSQYQAVCQTCDWRSSAYLFPGPQPAGAGWAGMRHCTEANAQQ